MALNLPPALPMPAARSAQAFLGGAGLAQPWTLIAWALFDWLVIGLAWAAMTRFHGATIQILGTVIVASRVHALGVILHDACHRPRRHGQQRWRWWLVEMLAGWPIASTISAMRYHHLRHHALSGTPRDPYRAATSASTWPRRLLLVLRGVVLPFWWTLRALVAPVALLVPGMRTLYGRAFLQDASGQDLRNHAGVIACARADIAQLLAQAIVFGAAFSAGLPVLRLYVLPWMLAGIANAWRIVHEHSWMLDSQWSRRRTWDSTLDHDLGPVGNALLYPHNVGLHRAHHLFPTVSFVHLRRLAAAIRARPAVQT